MSNLPQVTGQRLSCAVARAGFIELRQRGSHVLLRHKDDLTRRVVVPVHGDSVVKPGTLRSILRGAQLSADELRALL